jgi:hypothetical protein
MEIFSYCSPPHIRRQGEPEHGQHHFNATMASEMMKTPA